MSRLKGVKNMKNKLVRDYIAHTIYTLHTADAVQKDKAVAEKMDDCRRYHNMYINGLITSLEVVQMINDAVMA